MAINRCGLLLGAVLAFSSLATAKEELNEYYEVEQFGDARASLYLNDTSSVVSLLAIGAVLILGLAVVLYLYDFYATRRSDTGAPPTPQNVNYYGQYESNGYQQRSASDGYDFNGLNVIQWISMLQEVYEKFDYNDLECQKRLVCEVLREPDYFGSTARKMKHGFQLARYLEVLNMPDDFRELLDEYLDASERANGQKDCNEFYQCPYSLKDSIKRNFSGNSL